MAYDGVEALPRAYHRQSCHRQPCCPQARAQPPSPVWVFKRDPVDFCVDEVLGFDLTGSGEHLYLYLRKQGLSTRDVVKRLARASQLPERAIAFAGLKDKQGVCRQWFSLHLPGRAEAKIAARLNAVCQESNGAMRIEQSAWNCRKLRRGSHRSNRFDVRLYAPGHLNGEQRTDLQQRVKQIAAQGVPNYFGEQRFGFDNLRRAEQWFLQPARRLRRSERSLLISAARSAVFNAVLAARVRDANWQDYLDGDVMNLNGSASIFVPKRQDSALQARLQAMDIHPTGPLWGQGERLVSGQMKALEDEVLADWLLFCQGLEGLGLSQQRRSLRLPVQALHYRLSGCAEQACTDRSGSARETEPETVLELSFELPPGCYATVVLRELADYVTAPRSGKLFRQTK